MLKAEHTVFGPSSKSLMKLLVLLNCVSGLCEILLDRDFSFGNDPLE